jgi:hypothetical protein
MEPERPIEKLLRAFAKKRRDQAGQFELHQATRNLLQGEVSRELGAKTQAGGMSGFFRFWPRLAYGFGLFAVLGVITYFIWLSPTGEQSTGNLAQNPTSQADAVNQAAPMASSSLAPESGNPRLDSKMPEFAVAPTAAKPAERDKDDSPAPAAPAIVANGAASVTQPKPPSIVAANEPAPIGVAEEQAKLYDRARANAALSKAPAMAPVQTKAKAEVLTAENVTATREQKESSDTAITLTAAYRTFAAEARNRKTPVVSGRVEPPPTPSVLASFRMERTGDEIKITDGDGSIYRGRVVTGEDNVRRSFGLAITNIVPAPGLKFKDFGTDALGQPVSFSVSGTNVTLKTLIVFTGTFTPAQPVQSLGITDNKIGGVGGAGGGSALAAKRAVLTPGAPTLPGITGKMKIGADNQPEIPVNATPTGP